MSAEKPKAVSSEYEGTFTNKDGKKLFCRYWGEEAGLTNPKALLFIAHGAAEHCLWYTTFAQQLIEKGIYTFAHDHIGHGQSEGDRVHVDSFNQYVRDVFDHIDHVQKKFPGVPVFIIGHSMGGTITIRAAMEKPKFFKGIVLISPAVIPDPSVATPTKIFLGRMVARIVPQMPIVQLDTNNISRDRKIVQQYEDDPLVYHGKLKAKMCNEMLSTLEYINSHLESVDWPFLVVHGTKDKMCHPDGSRKLYEKASSKDKAIKMYEDYYHQVHNEIGEDGPGVRNDIIKWIAERL